MSVTIPDAPFCCVCGDSADVIIEKAPGVERTVCQEHAADYEVVRDV